MTISLPQWMASLEQRTAALTQQFGSLQGSAMPSAAYVEARHALDSERLLVLKASERNAPIVVCNHLLTVLLGAVLPVALRKAKSHPIYLDLCSSPSWFGFEPCQYPLPGVGNESLTFFTVSLLLIVFGKLVPERIGRKHNTWIVANFRGLIEVMSVLVGWLIKPMLAVGDFFLLFF